MERLTEETQIGPFASLKDKAESVPGAFNTYDCLYSHMVAVTRLKQYEDTGLTPEDLEAGRFMFQFFSENRGYLTGALGRLAEILEAEKAGRLVVLPCKVGDTVWFNTYEHNASVCVGIRPHTVTRFDLAAVIHEVGDTKLSLRDFGKTVFLTREEAKAALKGQEE